MFCFRETPITHQVAPIQVLVAVTTILIRTDPITTRMIMGPPTITLDLALLPIHLQAAKVQPPARQRSEDTNDIMFYQLVPALCEK